MHCLRATTWLPPRSKKKPNYLQRRKRAHRASKPQCKASLRSDLHRRARSQSPKRRARQNSIRASSIASSVGSRAAAPLLPALNRRRRRAATRRYPNRNSATVATASAGATSVRTRVRDAGAITAVNGRNVRTVKTVTRVQSARSENKGRRAASVPRGTIAHPRNGPIRGSRVHRNTDAHPHPRQERLMRGKAITSASAAVAAVATAANGVSAAGLHPRHLIERKPASPRGPPRPQERGRGLPRGASNRDPP